MSDKQMKTLGWVATFMSVMMYVSYVPQIMDNLSGHKGNFIQPLVAAVNCSLWVYYGLFKKERDLPLAAANAPGIIFGLITALTALFYNKAKFLYILFFLTQKTRAKLATVKDCRSSFTLVFYF